MAEGKDAQGRRRLWKWCKTHDAPAFRAGNQISNEAIAGVLNATCADKAHYGVPGRCDFIQVVLAIRPGLVLPSPRSLLAKAVELDKGS